MLLLNEGCIDSMVKKNLGIYWSEIGVENIFDFPQSTYYRWEQINNLVWQEVKILKKQRKHEEIEKKKYMLSI